MKFILLLFQVLIFLPMLIFSQPYGTIQPVVTCNHNVLGSDTTFLVIEFNHFPDLETYQVVHAYYLQEDLADIPLSKEYCDIYIDMMDNLWQRVLKRMKSDYKNFTFVTMSH